MEEILSKLVETGYEVTVRECYGVYDSFIRVKYGPSPRDLGWVYLKDNKIILINIKDEQFEDLDSFIQRMKDLQK